MKKVSHDVGYFVMKVILWWNLSRDESNLVMKVMIVKELMTGDVSPVAMFGLSAPYGNPYGSKIAIMWLFSPIFWPFRSLFWLLWPHLCIKLVPSTPKPSSHIGLLMRYPFAISRHLYRVPGVQKWPIWDQKWPNMAGMPMSRCGPKGSQMVNITCFWPFGTIWTHLHHFGPFKTKNQFFASKTQSAPWPK